MSKTWWVVRWWDGVIEVVMYFCAPQKGCAIGPYWTREEAEKMLKKWS